MAVDTRVADRGAQRAEAPGTHCHYCGGKLDDYGYHWKCHVCGAAYCYVHMARHDRAHPRPHSEVVA
jgi:hypothetical protein